MKFTKMKKARAPSMSIKKTPTPAIISSKAGKSDLPSYGSKLTAL